MGLEAAILTAVKTPAVVAIVGDRVRPLAAAQADARPFITYQVTGRGSDQTLADGPCAYKRGTFELGLYADTYAEVIALADLARDRLDGLGVTAGGVELDTEYEDETDTEEATPEGTSDPIYVRVLTFRALYRVTG